MKKIILLSILCISFFGLNFNNYALGECKIIEENSGGSNGMSDVQSLLKKCKANSLVDTEGVNGDLAIEKNGGFSEKIQGFITNLMLLAGVLAIMALSYGGLLMTISGGNEEKIKSGKRIFSWASIGFLGVITASGIITIIIKLIFELGG